VRRFLSLSLIAFVMLSAAAFADGDSEEIRVWHQFYFDKGLDYNQFAELGSTRTEFRRLFVDEIAALMELGAEPIDAAAVLLALDGHYIATLNRAARGLEASFAAEFRSALLAQYEATGKPQRVLVCNGAYFAAPDAPATDRPENVDVVASGTWSNIDGDTVRVTADFAMIGTGRMISFTAQGNVPSVARNIAFQLFDFYEKHRFAQPENPHPQLELRPALPGHQSRMGVPRDVAIRACESQGYRLPYSYELDVIFAMGAYDQGGIQIDSGWYYHVADDADHVWLAPGKLEHVRGASLPNFDKRDFYYVMVEGPPSPKVQLITQLDAYLKSESRKPEAERDTLAIYAMRLVLAELNPKHPENDIAKRAMLQEFAEQGLAPWDYLQHKGVTRDIGLTRTTHYDARK